MNCIAMRVAIVSAIMNGSSMCQYKHTRLWLECIWFLNAVLAAFAIYLCVGLQQAHRRTTVLRAAKSKHC